MKEKKMKRVVLSLVQKTALYTEEREKDFLEKSPKGRGEERRKERKRRKQQDEKESLREKKFERHVWMKD